MSNLPKRHPSSYVDPLEAENSEKAIGVSKSHNIIMAIGDETKQEWIRMEQ